MAKRGSLPKATCKEWAKHLKKRGKRDASKAERKGAKQELSRL